jgi:hypothetical protein
MGNIAGGERRGRANFVIELEGPVQTGAFFIARRLAAPAAESAGVNPASTWF